MSNHGVDSGGSDDDYGYGDYNDYGDDDFGNCNNYGDHSGRVAYLGSPASKSK